MQDFVNIGTLIATFGVKGEMVLEHHLGNKPDFKDVEAFFLEDGKDRFIPYFIKEKKVRNEGELLVFFEGIESVEEARKFIKKKIWLPDADVKKMASKSAPISFLGFSIIEKKKFLGLVIEVIEQPMQILLRTEMEKKEVLIPLNESTLVNIDHKNKKIIVDLPKGLLDIYLS